MKSRRIQGIIDNFRHNLTVWLKSYIHNHMYYSPNSWSDNANGDSDRRNWRWSESPDKEITLTRKSDAASPTTLRRTRSSSRDSTRSMKEAPSYRRKRRHSERSRRHSKRGNRSKTRPRSRSRHKKSRKTSRSHSKSKKSKNKTKK